MDAGKPQEGTGENLGEYGRYGRPPTMRGPYWCATCSNYSWAEDWDFSDDGTAARHERCPCCGHWRIHGGLFAGPGQFLGPHPLGPLESDADRRSAASETSTYLRTLVVDSRANYQTLLKSGIVIWPVVDAWFDLEMGDRPEGQLESWTSELIAAAEADGLRAGQFWFHQWTFTWPCVQLLRPDGARYPSAEGWDGFPCPPRTERSAAILGPLIERDWGETLLLARMAAQG